ncbi:MAG TPA: phosphate ABC transporter permease PstA [Gaiellaceae bacterium]|jgi:phosphate transport system permease protein
MGEPAFSLKATGRLRRRQLVNKGMGALAVGAALLAVAVLAIVVISVGSRGAGSLNLAFFTQNQAQGFNPKGGGVLFAIVGSAMLVGIATLIALPLGVLIAIYISELAPPRLARVGRMALDISNGIPTIVVGIFVFTILVAAHGQSAFAGSIALAIIMLPLIARATEEVLLLVPSSQREASLALGVSRWRTTVQVVIPSALGGIFTGTTLAIARVAGETAPLLFLTSLGTSSTADANPFHPLQSLTLVIFSYSEQADPAYQSKAWAAAFTLMCFVLFTSLAAKLTLARYRKKLGG